MYLMINNYDSFVYNLVSYLKELGVGVKVISQREASLRAVKNLAPKAIIISPGPKSPEATGACLEIIAAFKGKIPILGVCLGHQTIAYALGANISKGKTPVHGKVTPISNSGKGIFQNLPKTYRVTRYHSLVVENEQLPGDLVIEARGEGNTIMALSHRRYPIYGVQFHPEAVLTEYGRELLQNFITITEEWWNKHDTDH
ncbi:MAG: aminodeoxychorismate/anthranilate synthase component II [Bacillota bacterium]|nr:aminodeoxychorismate/anthranilate synthase component II [Bacillota bacterium]